jgi:hypothetical protein
MWEYGWLQRTFFDDDGEQERCDFFELDIYQIHHSSIQQLHDVAVRALVQVKRVGTYLMLSSQQGTNFCWIKCRRREPECEDITSYENEQED